MWFLMATSSSVLTRIMDERQYFHLE
uniref:Uncharacterized protein n=1 Tax=Anguilla anguilla TaxID=7936 RepID=A0A0E9V9D9_ANGAN